MTPIGHFACSSAVAGNIDLTTEKETVLCFLYYLLFLFVFGLSSLFVPPGPWAMYLHDQFGNAALLIFLLWWGRKEERKQFFVCLLIGAQILSAYTHVFDILVLKFAGEVPSGMWRPHNILHTPLAALVIPLIFTPIAGFLMKNKRYAAIYFFLSLGYFLHIFGDTITYDYQIYLFWPLSGYHLSFSGLIGRPCAVSEFLGNPLYIFSQPSKENVDGFIVYKAELLVNSLLALLFFAKITVKKILKHEA